MAEFCQMFWISIFELHLVKISCKLIIIWVNYEWTKKGAFLWNIVYIRQRYKQKETKITQESAYLRQVNFYKKSVLNALLLIRWLKW